MNCETVRNFLDAYSTGELDLVSTMETEKHLTECKACAKELETLRSVSETLKDPSLRYAAPAALQQQIARQVGAQSRSASLRVLARIAAGFLIFLLPWLGWYWSATRSGAVQLADEITSSHVRSLQGEHLLDVVSTDQHTVKPWFSGKLDFSPAVVDLKSEGFPLVGGRLDYVERRTVAAIVYQRGKHVINVFVWPTGERDVPPSSSQQNGYNLVNWSRGGLRYSAVSDVNEQDLGHLANLIRTGGATTNKS